MWGLMTSCALHVKINAGELKSTTGSQQVVASNKKENQKGGCLPNFFKKVVCDKKSCYKR